MLKWAAGLALLAFVLAGSAVRAQSQSDVTIKVGTYGGTFDDIQMKYAASRFTAKTGVKVQLIDGNADDHLAKMIASRGRDAPYDVIFLDDSVQYKAIAAHVLAKMTEQDVPNLKYTYDEVKSGQGYGPAMDLYSCGIAYNTQKFKEAGLAPPTAWADLWKPELAGHVGVPTLATTMGQCLLAAAERLAGGDESTPDKGITKLAEIKAQSYPGSSSTITTLLTSGSIWIVPWLNGRVWSLADTGVPVAYVLPSEGGFRGMTMVDVTEGSKHKAEAFAYVNEILGPLFGLGMASEFPYGPTNRLLAPILQSYPEMSSKFPASPAELDKLQEINWAVFNPQLPKAIDLWNRQVLSK
jgi:putative spermidine/putrescine transport system substrate-binding protein